VPIALLALVALAETAVPGTDYAGATLLPACARNFQHVQRDARDVDLVVIHVVRDGQNDHDLPLTATSAIRWFGNCRAGVSAHYVVDGVDGDVVQTVPESEVAWHAGNKTFNATSIGIEHEGAADDPTWFSDALYTESAKLVADICRRHGFPCDRAHVIGHDEVPDPHGGGPGGAGHHADPGTGWDWDRYMALIAADGATPEPPRPKPPTLAALVVPASTGCDTSGLGSGLLVAVLAGILVRRR
jgi:hypothetical protein